MSAILNKAAVIGDGDERLSVGGRVENGEISEVKLQANKDSEARGELVGVFTDGSMNEEGRVGGGWYVEGLGEGKERLGKLADREVVGMRGELQPAPEARKISLLSDSQAAIAAVRKGGQIGRARVEGGGGGSAEEAEKSGTRLLQICMGEDTRRNSRQ